MKTRTPILPTALLLVLPWTLCAQTRAPGPDDPLPASDAPAPAQAQAPALPPAPPLGTPVDLMQMDLDVTPPPLSPAPAASVPPVTPTPGPSPSRAMPTPSTPAPSPGRNNGNSNGRNRRGAAYGGSSPAAAPATQPAAPPVGATPAAPPPLDQGATTPGQPATASPAPAPGIRLNFQNASLGDVLNYLSAAAGFIITQEVPVNGTVNVVSQQPMSADEAVDLLNTILAEKGYVALRSGRILKIIALQDAAKRDLPVDVGSKPEAIPRKDNMVTQILPVRFAEVGKLVDNLRPLLSANATISSNDSSNAIILTDTQTNIHRMAEIIHALDTSISAISTIRVFPLHFSDAKGLADVLTQLFSPQQQQNNNQFPGVPPQFAAFMRGQQQAAAGAASPQSEARAAAARVVAVADETSNSVIISAPEEVMNSVAEVIARLDTSTSDVTETQIFRLLRADATELAAVLSSLYSDTGTTSNNNQPGGNNNNNRGGQQQGGQNRGGNNQGGNNNNRNTAGMSERALLQTRVVAVADARTNSVLVSASHDTMAQIALTIGRLDATDAKKQHVTVYTLSHADPDNVATILRGMYSTTSSTASSSTATQPSISALPNRTSAGASSDITNTLNTSSTSGAR